MNRLHAKDAPLAEEFRKFDRLGGPTSPPTPDAIMDQPRFKDAVLAALDAFSKTLHPEIGPNGGASTLELAVFAQSCAGLVKEMNRVALSVAKESAAREARAAGLPP